MFLTGNLLFTISVIIHFPLCRGKSPEDRFKFGEYIPTDASSPDGKLMLCYYLIFAKFIVAFLFVLINRIVLINAHIFIKLFYRD